ncbi:hypothetical protein [Mesorhizobium sp.]|uniref:hypothetical protein n=1 Tax=Mesorhizobium sp. TaxID=1871066 RepID=UPI000FE8A9C0|nr:hypothetical protein [Mesorhizobium sp.]RWO58049.1 MAG: hypothetical protein EOS14_21150 [Mesorhizobium sp.]
MPASTTRLASAVKTARRLLNSIIAVVALTAVLTTFAASALAHDATPTAAKPQGWSYPFSCCSGYDCRAVSQTSISERPEGYVIKGTGEVVGYSDARIKNSPDGEYHWCSVAGANDGKTICLFVPPSSF